ncbi:MULTISPECIES: hypothetical protein [unclassified Sphingomonas]|jgi:hypothetical protein|nr:MULTISPECIES: hypothetical protein [unclassified Sphingomonas]
MDPKPTPNATGTSDERRRSDRRVAQDPSYAGPERRQQDRRNRG